MSNFRKIATVVLAVAAVSATLNAESRCPGNVASLPFRIANRHQMIVSVSVNHQGPFAFLLDTGTQITMVAPSLATALHLESQGEAAVASAGIKATASFTQLDVIEAGTHSLNAQRALIYDLQKLQATGLNIQGVLGEDFLEHYDMLIDNKDNIVCLDDTASMRGEVKGTHIDLLAPASSPESAGLPNSLIISAKLSDGMRSIRLKLDSGANTPFLYNTSDYMALGAYRGASIHGGGVSGAQQNFTLLRPQTMTIGSIEVHKTSFVTLAGVHKDTHTSNFDGLLTMGLFKRVFINHTDNFAILDPW
jgi:hypothetical protein